MNVRMIAFTGFMHDMATECSDGVWLCDRGATSADNLAEFAGRACYDSFDKPNPKTRSNADYLAHILAIGHGSVLEHASATFYITGVSRSLTHELARHRHLSFSQLSQRFVVPDSRNPVCPPLFAESPGAVGALVEAWHSGAIVGYGNLLHHAIDALKRKGVTGTDAKKRAREAARAILPNMTPTNIVVTGNHRAWREMLVLRGSLTADAEIRGLALALFDALVERAPSTYQDIRRLEAEDGREYLAWTPHAEALAAAGYPPNVTVPDLLAELEALQTIRFGEEIQATVKIAEESGSSDV